MKIVLFAGGVGTRLWPLSRKNTPKQFEKIVGNKSMLQIAVGKLLPSYDWKDIYIATNVQYGEILSSQLPNLPKENVVLEPAMRDIGPAVGLVTAIFNKRFSNEAIALLWGSDHLVKKEEDFRNALKVAEDIVKKDGNRIVFLGQTPRFASQNLGYIEFGKILEEINGIPVHEFTGFQYRPHLSTAEKFMKDGHHTWNLGYFVTTPAFLWGLFEKHAPSLFSDLSKIYDAVDTEDFDKVLSVVYPEIEKISFDNAILEKIDPSTAYVLSIDIGWSDIGAWEALKEALSENADENVTKGKVLIEDSRDNLVFNYTNQLTVGIDLEEMLVINTSDVILVCPKASVPKIKKIVEGLAGTSLEGLA
jgi:mannose-1-phosphate guanylyltransferase